MRSPGSRIARTIKLSSLIILIGLIGVSFTHHAYASDTTVRAAVSGSQAPDLQLSGLTSPVTVQSMPLNINGTVSNLTQIQIYVDGAFSSTIPLTPSSTTFSYSLNLTEGTHTIQLIGISAYTSTNPTVSLTVTYTPPLQPPAGGTNTGNSQNTAGGVVIGGQLLPSLSTPAIFSVPIPEWFYKTLVFIDIVNPNKVNDTAVMFGRFLLMLIGLFFVIFARVVLSIYRWFRYYIFGWDKRPLPYVFRHRPLFWIRCIGLALVIITFVWL